MIPGPSSLSGGRISRIATCFALIHRGYVGGLSPPRPQRSPTPATSRASADVRRQPSQSLASLYLLRTPRRHYRSMVRPLAAARMIKKLAGILSPPLLQLHGAQDECTVAPTDDAAGAGSSTASCTSS